MRRLNHLLLLPVLLFAMGPVLMLLANSLRTNEEILTFPLGLPTALQWGNYPAAWEAARFSTAFRNSLFLTLATILGVSLIGIPAAYALARLRPRGNQLITVYFLVAITIPAQLYLVPLFFIWARLDLIDTLPALIPIYCAIYLPFSIFLLRSYFLSLPLELEDAARIDGCSELQVLAHIIVPLSTPAVTTLAVIVSVWSWNEFLFAATMLRSAEVRTVTLNFMAFTSSWETDFAQQSAGAVLAALPVVLLYVLLQRQFVQGVAQGGVKL
jgi:raffinose/stachyose/melibiose transport system permease protein